ncbi:response regulator [uncultured Pseudodesulfovibrio sp.]|uniref:response regulator n=1 Tax=uncultured Pseudodesulfovibrio sp. TaxID=2035858 RepID=UPI0029C702CC|nr:response regulator [uncultured Pseudodesulfovibrio sp.]
MERTYRVLLVDDEEAFTSALSKRLSRRGLDVKTASDGNEGLGLIESEAFDVVVLDVKMPGMSGMQVLKAIKGRFPDIEVILLSGHADMDDAVDSLAFGAFDFLVKPTSTERLLCRILDAAKAVGFRSNGSNGCPVDVDRPTSGSGSSM